MTTGVMSDTFKRAALLIKIDEEQRRHSILEKSADWAVAGVR
jgi:hypothetical protein